MSMRTKHFWACTWVFVSAMILAIVCEGVRSWYTNTPAVYQNIQNDRDLFWLSSLTYYVMWTWLRRKN